MSIMLVFLVVILITVSIFAKWTIALFLLPTYFISNAFWHSIISFKRTDLDPELEDNYYLGKMVGIVFLAVALSIICFFGIKVAGSVFSIYFAGMNVLTLINAIRRRLQATA